MNALLWREEKSGGQKQPPCPPHIDLFISQSSRVLFHHIFALIQYRSPLERSLNTQTHRYVNHILKLLISKYGFKIKELCVKDTPWAASCVYIYLMKNFSSILPQMSKKEHPFSGQPKILLVFKSLALRLIKKTKTKHRFKTIKCQVYMNPRRDWWFCPKQNNKTESLVTHKYFNSHSILQFSP